MPSTFRKHLRSAGKKRKAHPIPMLRRKERVREKKNCEEQHRTIKTITRAQKCRSQNYHGEFTHCGSDRTPEWATWSRREKVGTEGKYSSRKSVQVKEVVKC